MTTPRRALTNSLSILAMLVWLGLASNASALILTGGPTYTLPGGGSCSVAGISSQTGGATLSCTGVNLAAHTHVYFGIRNNANVNGNTMTGTAPAAGSGAVFRYSSSTGSSITYGSTTTIADQINGTQTVTNQLVLTLTGGSASVVATGGTPANNSFGDIERVFSITSGSFSIRADVRASDPFFPIGQACPAVYDPTHQPATGTSDISKADLAFYFSDCGDSQVDSPEQCDIGAGNGAPGSCCKSDCTFQPSGAVCRPGVDAQCDTSEACTGAAATCPPDDAPINGGVVCRPGSGDDCDENEECTGVPGQACPPDDAPGNVGVLCRPSSVAGAFCDEPEYCDGMPGNTCPPNDAPGKINAVCRPGSGDACDPDERCTGVSGQGCPADVVAPPSTVCRTGSGDSCDPDEHCTAVPTQPCPGNTVTPAGTVCRPATGTCDVAEHCTGTVGATCPGDAQAPFGTACEADSDLCTVDHCDGNGDCVFLNPLDCQDGNTCTQDSCDPDTGCVSSGTPSNSCLTAVGGSLQFRENAINGSRNRLKFRWKGGPVLVQDMGNPTQTTRYELCIYDGHGVFALGVPPGTGWRTIGPIGSPRGYKFFDREGLNQGVTKMSLKASSLQSARLGMSGKGPLLPNPPIPFLLPVTAQLYASDGGCWDVQFDNSTTKRNSDGIFQGKTP